MASKRVYFDMDDFNTNKHGLIYGDRTFLHEVKLWLQSVGYPTDITYSEHGMQGRDYVSFDMGPGLRRALF